MTVQFNQERYQSDRLTFERQQFEDSVWKTYHEESNDLRHEVFHRPLYTDDQYSDETVQDMWDGWKLAKGIKC